MAEWLYEDGIGEERAILVENGRIIAARIERHQGMRPGMVAEARLVARVVANSRGIVRFANGAEALLSRLPKGLNEGASLMVEVTRTKVNEKGRFKLPVVRAVDDKSMQDAPKLIDQLGGEVTHCHPHGADRFEQSGWGELLEEARTGDVAFPGGMLHVSLTPAMTLIDVDGDVAPAELACKAAIAAGRSIQRLDLQGNIGIDFPTLEAKADRQAAVTAFDATMCGNFERTAINGFGFMQIVTRRTRQSIAEMVQYRPALAEALALLRRGERDIANGGLTLVAHPAVLEQIEQEVEWTALLSRRTGRPISLRADPQLAIGAGYVEATS